MISDLLFPTKISNFNSVPIAIGIENSTSEIKKALSSQIIGKKRPLDIKTIIFFKPELPLYSIPQ